MQNLSCSFQKVKLLVVDGEAYSLECGARKFSLFQSIKISATEESKINRIPEKFFSFYRKSTVKQRLKTKHSKNLIIIQLVNTVSGHFVLCHFNRCNLDRSHFQPLAFSFSTACHFNRRKFNRFNYLVN